MLSEQKINPDEAERLLSALERPSASSFSPSPGHNGAPKYLRVVVDTDDAANGPTKVNVRVPMQLLRAGVRLTGVIPASAREEVNNALRKEGIAFDINNVTPQNLEELIEQLRELTVDVDNENTKVRVFCE
jgi:hypothetical protein